MMTVMNTAQTTTEKPIENVKSEQPCMDCGTLTHGRICDACVEARRDGHVNNPKA